MTSLEDHTRRSQAINMSSTSYHVQTNTEQYHDSTQNISSQNAQQQMYDYEFVRQCDRNRRFSSTASDRHISLAQTYNSNPRDTFSSRRGGSDRLACDYRCGSDDEDHDVIEVRYHSASYHQPRSMSGYTKCFGPVYMEGYLDKQSRKCNGKWKERYVVMENNAIRYYKSQNDAKQGLSCTTISLKQVQSIGTSRDVGSNVFQMIVPDRKYIFRARIEDEMRNWLFSFQKSIANMIDVLLTSKVYPHPQHRSCSRSISFDIMDSPTREGLSLNLDLNDSTDWCGQRNGKQSPGSGRTSPSRRSSSPLGMMQMFSFESTSPPSELALVQEDDDNNVVGDSNTNTCSSSPKETLPAAKPWVPRHRREGYTPSCTSPSNVFAEALEAAADAVSFDIPSPCLYTFADEFSYTKGDDEHNYGVTSLLGVRKTMEDVCCCIPDLSSHFTDIKASHKFNDSELQSLPRKHALYAIFDGHSGVKAAAFANECMARYLCTHPHFLGDPRTAFIESFQRIDDEFLVTATRENLADGTTAAVVYVRGNKLLTANVGDSRAVVSIAGQALDVIDEQTPGRADERERIEAAGGWVKEEQELQMSKLHAMDISDPLIAEKAKQVASLVTIYRVNGDLAVSRALGDMDYKGKGLSNYGFWNYPENHDKKFTADLVISVPELKEIEITPEVEFLILACDGLWDTTSSQEAVDFVARALRRGQSTTEVSHKLAKLAIRSGSSDNVSVVVVLLKELGEISIRHGAER